MISGVTPKRCQNSGMVLKKNNKTKIIQIIYKKKTIKYYKDTF